MLALSLGGFEGADNGIPAPGGGAEKPPEKGWSDQGPGAGLEAGVTGSAV